jgi:hypothetical protein
MKALITFYVYLKQACHAPNNRARAYKKQHVISPGLLFYIVKLMTISSFLPRINTFSGGHFK